MNEMYQTKPSIRWLGYSCIILAILGAAFCWWVPLGMVLSLAGLVLGFIDWTRARRRSLDSRLASIGMLLCALALFLDWLIALLGWQTITFGRN